MSATWPRELTDTLDCVVQVNSSPPSEPYAHWATCSCGLSTSMVGSRREARRRLEQMHTRKGAAA